MMLVKQGNQLNGANHGQPNKPMQPTGFSVHVIVNLGAIRRCFPAADWRRYAASY
jgi:hypothetical protein